MYYQKHVFICTNQKEPGKTCCANTGGSPFFQYAKEKLNQLNLHGEGQIRLSQSGCLGRCKQGPCLVIYPEAIWFTYQNFADIDQIIHDYLINHQIVERLLIQD